MPYGDSDGARIHYEVVGDGPPLLLHPGSLGRLQDWQRSGWPPSSNGTGNRNKRVGYAT